MLSDSWLLLLADGVLLLHLGVVLFVIAGLALIIAGNLAGWTWVNRFWFRLAHLTTIAMVAISAWFGVPCPLTLMEFWLRTRAGRDFYSQSFIEHWVQRLLFFEAPFWIFAGAYTLFGLLVAFAWWRFPPAPRKPPGQS